MFKMGAAKRIKTSARIFTFIFILAIAFSESAFAGKIGTAEKNAYLDLASNIPQKASLNFMAADLGKSMAKIDAILKKYQQEDQTFKYHQLVLSLQGSIGYNPFDVKDLNAMGLDASYGVFAFTLGQTGVPIIGFKALDVEKVKKALDNLAVNMGQVSKCPEVKGKDFTAYYFSGDGTLNTQIMLAYALSGKNIYLMVSPTNQKWFEDHLAKTIGLGKKKSLAADKNFIKLLGRMNADLSAVFYNDFDTYLKELKTGAGRLNNAIRERQNITDQNFKPLALVDSLLKMGEAYKAQIFALELKENKIMFTHEMIGNPKAVAKYQKIYSVKTKRFKNLPVNNAPIGYMTGKVNLKAIYNEFAKQSPEAKKRLDTFNQKLIDETGVDFTKDIMGYLTGEMAALFYGMEKVPESITKSNSVTTNELANLAKFVFVAGLKNKAKSIATLAKAAKAQIGKGKNVTVQKMDGFDVFWSAEVDGFILQFGVYKDLFVMGFGKDSIKEAFGKNTGINLYGGKNEIAEMNFDFIKFIQTMTNLMPPADSPNTQLYQQYQMWSGQIAPKIGFLDNLKVRAMFQKDGYRTEGELAF